MKEFQHCCICGQDIGFYERPKGRFDTCYRRRCAEKAQQFVEEVRRELMLNAIRRDRLDPRRML